MLFEYSLNNLAFVRYSKMQLLLPLIPKMFLWFLGPQNLKNHKIYFRIIIHFIRYGHYLVTSLEYNKACTTAMDVDRYTWVTQLVTSEFLFGVDVGHREDCRLLNVLHLPQLDRLCL